MTATTLQTATDADLRKLVKIAIMRDDAEAEIARRKALVEANAGQLKAKGVVVKGLGKLTYVEALVAYIHIKSPMTSFYGVEEIPAPLQAMKGALYAYLKECGTNLEANHIKEELATLTK